MRPALMGVILDESVDPRDISATIIDLAVRGYLTIEEVHEHGRFQRRDWRLTTLTTPPYDPNDRLLPWEERVLSGLFKTGDTVLLSELKTEFRSNYDAARNALYNDVVARRWFTRRPDKVRGRWFRAGILLTIAGVLLTVALMPWTHLGLVGVAVLVSGIAFLALHHRMPSRTARGSAALARTLGFRRYLGTAEADQLRDEEKAGIFARYLPYAIVFGETEHWARVFHDLGTHAQQYVSWYSGPEGWSFDEFGASMSDFTTTSAGTIVAQPRPVYTGGGSSSGSSGFSGGSSGGGGGGGGGGSW
jgi:uncharacterized membrane protein YgcG